MRRLWGARRPSVDAKPVPAVLERPVRGTQVRQPYVAPRPHWWDLVEAYPRPTAWGRFWFWRDY